MAEDFLSQDEVDALLKSTTGEVDEVKEEAEEGGIRNYNLATQERIVRGRCPLMRLSMNGLQDYYVSAYLILCDALWISRLGRLR